MENPSARIYKYTDFPLHYTWNPSCRKWNLRKIAIEAIGRLYIVQPSEGERGIIFESYLPMSKVRSASMILNPLMDIIVEPSKKHAFVWASFKMTLNGTHAYVRQVNYKQNNNYDISLQ